MDQTEVARLHDEYVAAWQRDDREAAMGFWSEDIVMRAIGCNPHAGVHRGRDAVRRNLIDRIYAETSDAVVLGLTDRAIGTDHVFTIVHERFGKADGRVLDTQRIVIYRWAGGRIVEVLYADPDQAAADAFWSD